MKLSSLKYASGSRKKAKRVGRGPGSGHGKTAGRGHNGQLSRSGHKNRAWFEGGQMPIQRRLPKRGFTNIFRREFVEVNLRDIGRLEKVEQITPELMRDKGLVSNRRKPIKILGIGDCPDGAQISAHAFSQSALKKIEAAGGKASVV